MLVLNIESIQSILTVLESSAFDFLSNLLSPVKFQ